MARTVDVDQLVERALAGDPRSIGRLITLVEDGAPQLRDVMAALAPRSGAAHIVGLTGSPGVGKSTTTSALVAAFRAAGRRVGVLAVDPSSPFSGGALLGDRIRMQEHATDPEVFIRSMASRGHLGGLASTTPQAVRVLDAAGCDPVLVETVGVGQSEVEVAGEADTTIVLLAPGMGDGIQAAKAGILEIGDIFVVNKADRDGADATARELRHMISLGPSGQAGAWKPPVLKVVATRGEGLPELVEAIDGHRAVAGVLGHRDGAAPHPRPIRDPGDRPGRAAGPVRRSRRCRGPRRARRRCCRRTHRRLHRRGPDRRRGGRLSSPRGAPRRRDEYRDLHEQP